MKNRLKENSFYTPRAWVRAEKLHVSLQEVIGSGPNGRIIEQDVIHYYETNTNVRSPEGTSKFKQRKITPLAQKIANIEKINLKNIKGTGINGKIMSADLQMSLNQEKTENGETKKPFTGIRKLIATRMSDSKRNAPHVTLTVKTEATHFVNFRTSLMDKLDNRLKISYTDLLIKIVAESLQEHPNINVSLEDEELIYHEDINIGVAIALEDGLVSPIIHNSDQKSITQIARDVQDKVNRARNGKLKSRDFENGRFTISNLGMYEVDAFTPIINQPESAILGVGRIAEDVIVQNEQIRIGKTMVLSLSFDHRVMDGAPAAMFLEKVKHLIEHPQEIKSLQV